MKKWVGSKVLLLLILAIITIMVDTCVASRARNELISEQSEKQKSILISNILLEGVKYENNLSCWPGGSKCNPFDADQRCCDGYVCDVFGSRYSARCVWCPGKGDSCGLLDHCCPGLS
uniref:Uncharacterized protein n=1 Tax=Chenopodium quinoa TaxID=63459 RepID=A0A803MWQ2_CHEQI